MDEESERGEFLNKLFTFMSERGTGISYIPVFDHRELDLWKLYKSVTSRGGLTNVVESKLWRQVTADLGVDQERTDAGFRLRMHYLKYLYPFERKFYLGMDDGPFGSPPSSAFASPVIHASPVGSAPMVPPSVPSPRILPATAAAAVPATAPASTSSSAAASPLTTEALSGPPIPALSLHPRAAKKCSKANPAKKKKKKETTRGCLADVASLDEATLERYRQLYRLRKAANEDLAEIVVEHFVSQEILDESSAISMFFSALCNSRK